MQIYRNQQVSLTVEYSSYRSYYKYCNICISATKIKWEFVSVWCICSSFQSLNPIGQHFIHTYVINPNLTPNLTNQIRALKHAVVLLISAQVTWESVSVLQVIWESNQHYMSHENQMSTTSQNQYYTTANKTSLVQMVLSSRKNKRRRDLMSLLARIYIIYMYLL